MSNKEILSLRIMGKDISIACPPEDKPGLEAAANLLNQDIDLIPDKANALILASLNLAFKQMKSPTSDSMDSKIKETIEQLSTKIEKALS